MCWLRRSLIVSLFLIGLLFYVTNRTNIQFAQESHCDPNLKQTGSDPNGYHLRGDRCEGVYIREVGSTPLLIASLTESFEDFNPAANQNLQLEWMEPDTVSIHLRAYALLHKLYYQMDSIRPKGSTSYNWPTNLLATLNLRRENLGVVAWATYLVGKSTQEVYLPLRIKQQSVAAKSHNYQLVLLPGIELTEVFISLAPVKQDGGLGNFVRKDKALGYGYYPAERGITITIPEPKAPGIYFLEIGATHKNGGSSTAKLWFYNYSN